MATSRVSPQICFLFHQPAGLAKGSVDKGASTKKEGPDPTSNGEEKSGTGSYKAESILFRGLVYFVICVISLVLVHRWRQRGSSEAGLFPLCRGNAKRHRM